MNHKEAAANCLIVFVFVHLMSVCHAICNHHNSYISSRKGVTNETTFVWGGHGALRKKKKEKAAVNSLFNLKDVKCRIFSLIY